MTLEMAIAEIKCRQEEAEECGDLEDRLELAQKLVELLDFKKSIPPDGKVKIHSCGLCEGSGNSLVTPDFEYECKSCLGLGVWFGL